MERTGEYQRGYLAGYRDGMAAGMAGDTGMPELLQQPVEVLDLSARPRNCLLACGCQCVADVVALSDERIRYMRLLGPKSADEVARVLRQHGILGTAWDAFLL